MFSADQKQVPSRGLGTQVVVGWHHRKSKRSWNTQCRYVGFVVIGGRVSLSDPFRKIHEVLPRKYSNTFAGLPLSTRLSRNDFDDSR